MKLLFLFVLECTRDDAYTLVADCITAEIQLSYRLTALEDAFQLVQAFKADVIFLEREHLEISFSTEGTAEGQGSLREDTVT